MSPQLSPRVPVTILLIIPAGVLAALAGIPGNIATSESCAAGAPPRMKKGRMAAGRALRQRSVGYSRRTCSSSSFVMAVL